MAQQYDVRCRHTDYYYHQTLLGLLSALEAGLHKRDMAQHLNERGLLSATGVAWTTNAVMMALHKLRHFREKSSHLHSAMNQLVFDGLLTRQQCLPLLQSRIAPQERM